MKATAANRYLAAACLIAAALLVSSRGAPGSQRADSSFDARVARPAYAKSGPRVLIDEAHRNFHTASGRYQPFARLIGNDGYRMDSNRAPFTAARLQRGDILVVSNAIGPEGHEDTSAFRPEEVTAVHEWVAGGGSLLLIAEHWPLGGAASDLSEAFGVEMSRGVTEDSVNCDSNESTSLVFSRENGLLADHPITKGRSPEEAVARVVTFTGQSLSVPPDATPILRLGATARDRRPSAPQIVKEGNSTRVTTQYGDPEPALGRAQGVALEFGKGRVVIFGGGRDDDRPDLRRRSSVRDERRRKRRSPARAQHHALAVAVGLTSAA